MSDPNFEKIAPNFDIAWKGDELRRVIVAMDRYDRDVSIYTQQQRRYLDYAGKEQTAPRGNKRRLIAMNFFFGKVHVEIDEYAISKYRMKEWELEVMDAVRRDLPDFFKTVFGHALEDIEWPRSFSRSDAQKTYDWELELELPTVDLEQQAQVVAGRIQHVLDAQATLRNTAYADLAKHLDSPLRDLRRDLRSILTLSDVSPFTPEHEIPSWFYKREECKPKMLSVARKFKGLYEEQKDDDEYD